MKKNKKLLLVILVVILLVVAGIIFFFVKPNNTEDNNVNTDNTSNESKEPEFDGSLATTNIKNSKETPLEVDEVEAKNIQIKHYPTEIEVKTTLKNNSKEELDGFFIHIGLYDSNGKQITSVAENSTETIPVNGEITIINSVSELENNQSITSAKILSLEKTNIKDALENTFDEMEANVPVNDNNDSDNTTTTNGKPLQF